MSTNAIDSEKMADEACERIRDAIAQLGLAAKALNVPTWRSMDSAPLNREVFVYLAPNDGLPGVVTLAGWHQTGGWTLCSVRETVAWIDTPEPPAVIPKRSF